MPELPSARSWAFIAGRTVSLALKARNHGSAIAGSCEDSFMSKNIYPVRSPLSSAKYAASRLRSSRMLLIVAPNLPFRAAALPASTGIETLSNIRIVRALLRATALYESVGLETIAPCLLECGIGPISRRYLAPRHPNEEGG